MPTTNLQHSSSDQLSRRKFIKRYSVVVGAAALTGPYILRGQNLNSNVHLAAVGANGKGESDINDSASCGADIVAICDVDERFLDARTTSNPKPGQKSYPDAKKFRDFRKMFDQMGKSIDAVTVSTPDHCHAAASVMAMKLGKHVYCQKPLTHSVYEARTMRQIAKEKKVATQMGNQGSAGSGLRHAVEVIQAGVIGPVRELHVWSNRPIWPQGIDRPQGEDPVPNNLDWNLWLGPAPVRPYKTDVYHTFKWRGWQDFGTGALGDMACHTVNMPFRALKLGYPTVVEAEDHTGINKETYPKSSRIRFEFPKREDQQAMKFWWYDGGWKPHADLTSEINDMMGKVPGSGCLLVGDKGKLFSPDDYGSQFYIKLKEEKEYIAGANHEAAKDVAQTIPRSPGHNKEWFNAMKGGPAPYSNFDIAAYLTEIILLGCVALRVGKKLDWDGPNMKAKNAPEAAQYVRREYRKGWTL